MPGQIDEDRFALLAILGAAHAERPEQYPDFTALDAMTDAELGTYAGDLLQRLEESSSRDRVAAELRARLSEVVRGSQEGQAQKWRH
jgi:hypothetical protein